MKDEDLVKLVDNLELTKNKLWKIEKKLLIFMKTLGVSAIEYGIMLYVMLWVYHAFGWERTLICLAVGVILFGLRQRFENTAKDFEIKELRKELSKVGK